MLKPLEQWYCDACGEVIQTPNDGYVYWDSLESVDSNFRIVHNMTCSPEDFVCSTELKAFLSVDGIIQLTSLLSIGPIKNNIGQKSYKIIGNYDEFVDFIRRVQIPHYEEARKLFSNSELLSDFSDSNEVYPYLQSVIKGYINSYKE